MQASPTDLWATSTTIEFAQSENIPVKILLNRFNPHAKLAKEIISQLTVEIFKNYFGNRVAFSACFLTGIAVTESAPSSQAASEVKAVTQEILKIFSNNNNNKKEILKSDEKRAIAKI
jgi:chromosome partitioning protein